MIPSISYIIDTNVLVGYLLHNFLEETPQQEKVFSQFIELLPNERLIPDFILCEFSILFQKVLPKRYSSIWSSPKYFNQITKKFEILLNQINIEATIVTPSTHDIQTAVERFTKFIKHSPTQAKITLADLMLVSLAEHYDAKLLTNEKKLQRLQPHEDLLYLNDALFPWEIYIP